MRYSFKATYNPEQAELDKKRMALIVEASDVMAMIVMAVSKLEIVRLSDEVVKEYLESIGSEDTTEGWSWNVWDNDGMWTFEWRPLVESDDPVTPETLKAWAMAQDKTSAEEAWVGVLACVMGRWYWRSIDEWSAHDLKEALHDAAMDGCSSKGYNEMTGDELLAAVMEGPVEAARDNFDEIKCGPFGLEAMIKADTELWLDSWSPAPVERQDLPDNGDEI